MQFYKSGSIATSENTIVLESGWQLTSTEPGLCGIPADLDGTSLEWLPAIVPGTVAQALEAAGRWSTASNEDFDARDWWFRCAFEYNADSGSTSAALHFNGLATIAEVWLNGACIVKSDNMFLEHEVDIAQHLQSSNVLAICFRSLNHSLSQKRPRPRWKTKLVNHQQLRWIRTTLLGRIPGWSPPVAPVGPWRSIVLEAANPVLVTSILLRPYVEGSEGVIDFSCTIKHRADDEPAEAVLGVAGTKAILQIEKLNVEYRVSGQLRIQEPQLWWPHTHGDPTLYPCELDVRLGDQTMTVDCGEVGFRTLGVNQDDGGFDVVVNNEPVFCRGACWTINDIVSLSGSSQNLERSLMLAREAGMNMLRVGGTMVYESELFYTLCDKLGIMVWQDFMFANMDYPVDDEQFKASVEAEITQQLRRWQSHPCIAVYCGNSEVEQQAAMLGIPRELWRSELFSELVPGLCQQYHPDIPYIPSTPSGGALPFHVATGITHYYGIGAYMRPMGELRRANVRFTPECLGFSNVPDEKTINGMFEGELPVIHHPVWKSRVPRDTGAGWDFEDVRDHYLKEIFQQDPVQLRCFDMDRYLTLSRVTTGEVMEQAYSEWRSSHSCCGGALVWFYKDLWPGAGWGVVDSTGTAKACYYYLKRVWQNQAVFLTDEGLDGVHVHVVNETVETFNGCIELALLRNHSVVVAKAEKSCEVDPRSKVTFLSDELLNGFYDVSYAYRFGPPKHDIVIASLYDAEGNAVSEAFRFPGARETTAQGNVELMAEAAETAEGNYLLRLQTDVFLQAVYFDVKAYIPDDNYFHLTPGKEKQVLFRRSADNPKKFKGYIQALNLGEPVKIVVKN
ncbi:MAG: glycoside hydrolase family 2 protein [Gammaproteobacteria bacterium]|jgi:beta-mannosidase